MDKHVTFKQLEAALSAFGFQSQSRGGHAIFRHENSGAVLTVPTAGSSVRPIYILNAARQIENSGIASTETFRAKLASVSRTRAN